MKTVFSVCRYVIGMLLWCLVFVSVRTPLLNNVALSIVVLMLSPFLITYFHALDFDKSTRKITFLYKKYKEQFVSDFMTVLLCVIFMLFYHKVISGLVLGFLIFFALVFVLAAVFIFNLYQTKKHKNNVL